jgi:hypothetical protein
MSKIPPNEKQIRGGQIAELSYEQNVMRKTSVFNKTILTISLDLSIKHMLWIESMIDNTIL